MVSIGVESGSPIDTGAWPHLSRIVSAKGAYRNMVFETDALPNESDARLDSSLRN
jgi:hypothetical protein